MKGQRRVFTVEFKRRVVAELKSGKIAISEIAQKFELSPSQIRQWKRTIESAEVSLQHQPTNTQN